MFGRKRKRLAVVTVIGGGKMTKDELGEKLIETQKQEEKERLELEAQGKKLAGLDGSIAKKV